jgi:hypothetical protein
MKGQHRDMGVAVVDQLDDLDGGISRAVHTTPTLRHCQPQRVAQDRRGSWTHVFAFLLLMRSAISSSSERFGSCSDGSHARSVIPAKHESKPTISVLKREGRSEQDATPRTDVGDQGLPGGRGLAPAGREAASGCTVVRSHPERGRAGSHGRQRDKKRSGGRAMG